MTYSDHKAIAVLMCLAVLLLMAGGELLAVPAFPGAEGAGANALGGRGGDVYHVTNLNNTGTGSLRYGITSATGARTIVFDVSGTIALDNTLRIQKSNITIAGQTAPGLGIEITNWDTQIEYAHDVVLQHLRFRPGLARAGTASNQYHGDSLEMNGDANRPLYNIMIDHVSASWSIDECLSSSGNNTNITVQWSYITEGLHDTTFHPYGPTQKHSDGSLFAYNGTEPNAYVTAHHNLWAHQNLRMPRARSYNFKYQFMDSRNNVMYDWGHAAAYGGGDTDSLYDDRSCWNFAGNYAIAGPSTNSAHLNYALEDWGEGIGGSTTWDMSVYLGLSGNEANKLDSDRDGLLDGVNTGWAMTTGPMVHKTTPYTMPGLAVTMDNADTAYNRVLAGAGALPWARDSVDARVTNEVITQTGRIINSQKDPNDPLADPNGYPIIPVIYRAAGWDTDADGMPNTWETWYGTNPTVADNNGVLVADGYKNLEKYLHWLGDNDLVHHPGDASGDDAVGLIDLGVLAANWNMTGKGWHEGNFDGSSQVDLVDLGLLAAQWGWNYPGASPEAVPEPATMSLLMSVCVWALLRRRR